MVHSNVSLIDIVIIVGCDSQRLKIFCICQIINEISGYAGCMIMYLLHQSAVMILHAVETAVTAVLYYNEYLCWVLMICCSLQILGRDGE